MCTFVLTELTVIQIKAVGLNLDFMHYSETFLMAWQIMPNFLQTTTLLFTFSVKFFSKLHIKSCLVKASILDFSG